MATKMACPSGYKLVNGKCVDANGNAISAPYVSKSGKFFPDDKSLTSGCNKNPNSPECKKVISGMTPEQRSKIKGLMLPGGKMQKLGGTTKSYKTGGMVNSNSKVSASKKTKGKVGGTSKAPKTALPKAMYGTSMKPGMMKKGGTKKK